MSLSPLPNLRVRLVFLVLIAIVPALGLILYSAWQELNRETARIKDNSQRIVRLFANEQERFIEGARQLLVALAQLPEVRRLDATRCSAFFSKLGAKYPLYMNFGAGRPDGTIFCTAKALAPRFNLAESPHFRRAIETRSFAVGDYHISPITGRPTLGLGYPVVDDNGIVLGVVFAAMDLAWLNDRAAELQLPPGSSVLVVNNSGAILARYPEPEKWVGKPLGSAPFFKALVAQQEGVEELTDLDGRKRLFVFTTLKAGGQEGRAHLAVGVLKDIAFAEVNRTLALNLIGLGSVSLLALVAAWFIGNPFVVSYISERLRAEEALARLGTIAESSGDAIVGTTLDGIITSWNKGAQNIYGYSAEEILGSSISTLIPPDRQEELPEILYKLKQGEHTNYYETVRLTKDGNRIDVSLTISPVKGRPGETIGASGIARDITEHKRMEQQQADFTAMIVHDLRTPLTTIVGAAGILQDDLAEPLSEQQKKWLSRVESASRNLLDLTNDFLDLSKLESGHIDLTKEEVDLRQLIQNSLDNYAVLAADKHIALSNRVDPSLPARIPADPRRLDQVFSNLLSNAIKFTPQGGTIEAGAGLEDSGRGPEVRLWVKDSGVGMPSGEIDQLFQKYRQTASGKNAQQGTGLGLVICKMIVEAHGGRIWVQSEKGRGTTLFFTLSLPTKGSGRDQVV